MNLRVLQHSEWLERWSSVPHACRELYWHPDYHRANGIWEGAKPECLLLDSPPAFCLYPYLKHPIVGYESHPDACDVQSAYGYGGPLFVGRWRDDERVEALSVARDHLEGIGAVAEFVRCHPEWVDSGLLSRAGYRTMEVRTNVECELDGKSPDELPSLWAPQARRNLKRAAREGLQHIISEEVEHLLEFERLYARTAERVGMTPFYRFDHRYFEDLLKLDPDQVKLVLVRLPGHAERFIAGAIILLAGTLAHYHLGASEIEFQSKRPNDYLYRVMATCARAAGCKRISWGGGFSAPNDSLFRFKEHFGTRLVPVFVAGRVIQPDAYRAICDEWARRHPDKARTSKLFLRYRG